METSLSIDCAGCILRDSDACSDCIVTFVCNREPDDAIIINADEERGLRLLSNVGLVPRLRFSAAG